MKQTLSNLLNTIIHLQNLLFTPQKEWERIAAENLGIKQIFLKFTFPLITICSLISFTGVLIRQQGIGIGVSMFFVSLFSLLAGIYTSAKFIEWLLPNFQLQIQSEIIFQLVIYSASIFCLFHGASKLFATYSFLRQICLLTELYFIRVLWIGTGSLLSIPNNKRPGFTIMSSILVIVLPLIFERMFSILFKLPITI
ncbi:hypothetical protein [Ancylomarina longa]|uniref:Yip1 domain-containing protein n=1 Tax=Ancylomarina longa TaxID=2487017 RepID=A0A434AVN2_9BACT|nr:hypothetical protein [Ancylomarina longa]RUT78518.1 hypothetical protein DLK05_08065 [Ancylomarina longa]